jgi:hypothetical protein
MTLTSTHPAWQVMYHVDPVVHSTVRVSTFVQRQEWKLLEKIKLESSTYRDAKSRGHPEKSIINITCKAKRHFAFFLWNVIALMVRALQQIGIH